MQDTAPKIPIALVEAALCSAHAAGVIAGRDTHVPVLHFIGEVVPFTKDASWIRDIVAGYLPANYSGNTLKEVAGMVSDSIKKGFDRPKKKGKPLTAAQEADAIIKASALEIFHTPQNVAFVAL